VPRLQNTQKHFLHDVFRIFAASHHSHGRPKEPPSKLVIQSGVSPLVTGSQTNSQRVDVGAFHSGLHTIKERPSARICVRIAPFSQIARKTASGFPSLLRTDWDILPGTIDAAQPRWYRLTPDRLVLLLLAVEGLPWLSERFEWFAFNRHKGWTLLIAMAAIAVAMVLMFLWFLAALVFRWRFQFSIRSLLVLTVVVAIACSWLAVERGQARKQREAVEGIERLNGRVYYDFHLDPSGNTVVSSVPPWASDLLGDALFEEVTQVDLSNVAVGDADLQRLTALPRLRWLFLRATEVSDAGLEHPKGLTRLQYLGLAGTKIGDAGLEHLRGLTRLDELDLTGTKVTNAGVKKLQQGLPKCQILR
jgi:hypothetical protein